MLASADLTGLQWRFLLGKCAVGHALEIWNVAWDGNMQTLVLGTQHAGLGSGESFEIFWSDWEPIMLFTEVICCLVWLLKHRKTDQTLVYLDASIVPFPNSNKMCLKLSEEQLLIWCKEHFQHGRTIPFFPKFDYFFGPCHNFFPLSSVQIIIIPACCLLCVL